MDAVEFFKTVKRLCKNQGCDGCPVCKNNTCMVMLMARIYGASDESIEETISKVEEWAKEHPVKTRQSELLKMFPKAAICDDVISICPLFYCVNFLGTNFQGYCHNNRANCNKCCREYWLTEVNDND